MTPDERQLLSGLFDRIRNASSQQRDRDAESFITDAVRAQPYAPYLLAQTVIVQEQALRAANERLQQLEAEVRQHQSPQGSDTSFLGGLGRSIFGGGNDQPQRPVAPPPAQQPGGGFGQPGGGFGQPGGGYGQQGYAPQPQQGPWGQAGAQPQGGGFLRGALGAAAGVAGGVLLANSISGLFRGSNPYGITSGVPGFGGTPGGETIVNNYYENDSPGGNDMASGNDYGPDNGGGFDNGGGLDNAADFGSDDGGFGSDDSYNV